MSDEPAFPQSHYEIRLDGYDVKFEGGLTKREYAAIKAMQGAMANPKFGEQRIPPGVDPEKILVDMCCGLADALLTALKEKT